MRVLLVCDVGASVGLGHWTRTRAVASALGERGAATDHLAFGDEPAGQDRFADATVLPGDANFAGEVLRVVAARVPDAVVFDLHPRRANEAMAVLLHRLSADGIRVVGIDSLRGQADSLDLLCIPSFYVEPALLSAHADKLVWGWSSILVPAGSPPREWSARGRVLVLTGGSDTTAQAGSLPALLEAALEPGTQLDWVRGPYASAPDIPGGARLDWLVHQAPECLDALMLGASYALTVFGVSLLELLKRGIPTVVFSPYGGANDVELQLLRSSGACRVADDAADASAQLVALMRDDEAARGYALVSRQLLASSGAGQLAQRIVEAIA
jgi:spore coat polysaccharide biosynthesis predicted glycosyltransferase SpsG